MSKRLYLTVTALCLCLSAAAQASFPYPAIPDSITSTQKRAEYLVCHYWDNYDFSDSTLLHIKDVAEQGFVNFIDLAQNNVDEADAYSGMKVFWNRLAGSHSDEKTKAAEKLFFMDLAEKYLYDWSSPMRNDQLYLLLARAFTETGGKDERQEWRIRQLAKNQVGKVPADIRLTTRNGKKTSLCSYKADYVVVMFYQPDCIECRETAKRLAELKPKDKDASIDYIAVYPGEDIGMWKDTKLALPDNWTDCYNTDKKIAADMIYYIRHTPSFYVISAKENKVVLKDASFSMLLGFHLFDSL